MEVSPPATSRRRNEASSIAPTHTHRSDHAVQFYEDEEFLAESIADFVSQGLTAGEPTIVIATIPHGEAIVGRLKSAGLDVDEAQREGRLACLDAREMLATFMVGTMPDERRFNSSIGGAIDAQLRRGYTTVRTYGEMVDVLWKDGNPAAAIRLEELWSDIAKRYSLSLLCAYSMRNFNKVSHARALEDICDRHQRVIPIDRREGNNEDRSRGIALLQQKACALATEVEERAKMEDVLRDALSDRKRVEEDLQRFAAIVRWSDDAIVSKNLDGVITSWNSGAERMFGYSAAEAVGRSIYMIVPTERHAEEDDVLARLRRGEMVDHFETIRRRRDGTEIAISLTVSPVRDSSGAIVGASKIARDISERRRIEEERERLLVREQQARAEAEQANRMKDEFLAMLSHELRTPLNAILGWTHVASNQGGQRSARTTLHRAFEVIEQNAALQLRLVDDLLDVSRILSGKLQLSKEPVDLDRLLAIVIDSARTVARGKPIDLDASIDAPGQIVMGDAARLQQVTWNLVSNAIKFTPPRGRVELRLESVDSGARIVVRDTGEGISPDFVPYVFDRFRQGDAATTRKHGGLGLGLSVARYLVEAHGGAISAQSPGEGLGSTFTVTLPTVRAKARVDDPSSIQKAPIPLNDIRLLVIDDDDDARYLLRCMLEFRGATVTTAQTADEVLGLLATTPFDVLLADLGMPGQDGYALITAIRAHPLPVVREIKAVAVTAYAGDAHRSRAFDLGYDDYLVKPVAVNRLAKVIMGLKVAKTSDSRLDSPSV